MNYKSLFDELVENHLGIEIHSVQFVPRSVIFLTPEEKLKSVNLSQLIPVLFNVAGNNYSSIPGSDNSSNILGATVCTIKNDKKLPVVFLPNDTEIENSNDEELKEEMKSLLLFLALLHELGHVKDMHEEINFGFSPESINLIEAESYAHSFTLNHCNKVDDKIARNTYAGGIYQIRNSQKEFDQKLYRSICKRIGKGRLKKWARA